MSNPNSTKPGPVSLRPAQDFILANWIQVGNEHFFTLKAVGAQQSYQFSSLDALLDFMRTRLPPQREN